MNKHICIDIYIYIYIGHQNSMKNGGMTIPMWVDTQIFDVTDFHSLMTPDPLFS